MKKLIALGALVVVIFSYFLAGLTGSAVGAAVVVVAILSYRIGRETGLARAILLATFLLSFVIAGFVSRTWGPKPPGIAKAEEIAFFVAGGTMGLMSWLLVVLSVSFLFSEIILVSQGGDRWESFAYLVNSLLLERAGALEIVHEGESITIKSRGMLAPFKAVGYVVIYHGNAVVFERFGRPSQVAGPGLVTKKPFETIRAVVDLSMQMEERTQTLYTRDGAPLTIYVRVLFQIDSGGRAPTSDDMHPFSEPAVFNAVYLVPDWKAYTIETAVALLRDMVCTYYLDEIFDPLKRVSRRRASPETHAQLLHDKLHTALSDTAIAWGVRIHRVELGIEASPEIEEQVLAFEKAKTEMELEYLATASAQWAAQAAQTELGARRAAQIELDALRLERCVDVMAISNADRNLAAGELAGPASALLRSFSRIAQDVDAALSQESSYNQRLALSAVEDRLDGLVRELTRSSEHYAARFWPIAARWRQIVADHVRDLVQAVELRQEIDNPYVIGVPLTAQQEIFVGRTDISARIEQLLLDRRRPPLLLYGQRRMGKTSLLNNLGRLLPTTIVPLFVDLQGPATQASDHAGFLYNIARGIVDSAERQRGLDLSPLPRETLETDSFTRFDEWVDEVEKALEGNTALLALDEFETLDSALTEGRFNETAVLSMLRHMIQHRPRFKVLLAGSHTLDELQRWASYLINVQVVHISYLKEAEARQLIEHPIKDFVLRYEPDASQRVLDITLGHPYLVQLLCAEIVALKNEQPLAVRRLARLADVEAAVPEALSHGSFFFADIQQNQVDAAGLALLRFLAAEGEGAVVRREDLARQFPDDLDCTLDLLLRRELIEPTDGGYRFQVELIRHWFAR